MRSLLLLTIFATGTNGSTMCQENYNSTVTISDGTHMKVKFELCKGWPKDGNLTIVPPGGYSISKDAAASGSGVTGGLSVLVNDENIIISRDGEGAAIEENSDGHAVEIEITGVIKAPVPMAPYRGNSADFTHTISRQCTAPPMTGQCLIVPLVQKNWSWDMSAYGGNCASADKSGDVTIAPGSGGAKRVQVATCTNPAGFTLTLFCQVDSTSAGHGTTLQSHYIGSYQVDGPPVTSGCSVITGAGAQYPNFGSCCFK